MRNWHFRQSISTRRPDPENASATAGVASQLTASSIDQEGPTHQDLGSVSRSARKTRSDAFPVSLLSVLIRPATKPPEIRTSQ